MTFNPYDYSSPYPEQQPNFPAIPQAPVTGQPPWTLPMQPVTSGPLAGLQDSVAGVLNAADQHHMYIPGPGGAMPQYPRGRQQSVLGDMIKGALLGLGGGLLWRHLRARKRATGQYFPAWDARRHDVGRDHHRRGRGGAHPVAGFLLDGHGHLLRRRVHLGTGLRPGAPASR